MVSKIFTATNMGLNVKLVEIEIDLTPAIPSIVIVGLPDKAVQESKERIRSSIKQSGYEFPLGRVTINLAPADLIKSGSSFDLPVAIGILRLVGYIREDIDQKTLFLGELALDGRVRKAEAILSVCIWAKKNGYQRVFIPKENSQEGSLVGGIEVFGLETLDQAVKHLNKQSKLEPVPKLNFEDLQKAQQQKLTTGSEKTIWQDQEIALCDNDMAYIKGQDTAKRALEIAASGGHNILLVGAPGSGKTLMARSYASILPRLSEKEILEVTQIYSVAGLLPEGKIITQRSFRSPHHTSSQVSLVGGGSKLRPGEVSLAHRGVLFLDEFPEFDRYSIEALRQPLEDGFVTISRAKGSVVYPCRFYLIAAANPTPSGFDPEDLAGANKPQTKSAIARYQAKFSGPILDRIDLQIQVDRPKREDLEKKSLSEPSKLIFERVQKARNIQTERFGNHQIHTNSEMSLALIKKYCQLDQNTQKLLNQAVDKYNLSARAYMRLLKISRTVADLDASQNIQLKHLAESLQYRGKLFTS